MTTFYTAFYVLGWTVWTVGFISLLLAVMQWVETKLEDKRGK